MQKITELSMSDFSSRGSLKSGKNTFVLVYAPWCGYCHAFMPVYSQLAGVISRSVDLKTVNSDTNKSALSVLKDYVNGYPTVLYFSRGRFAGVYNGPRTVKGMVDFVRSN